MATPLLYDWSGKPVSTAAAPLTCRPAQALSAPQGGVVALGSDYAAAPLAQVPRIDPTGNLHVISTPNGPESTSAANAIRAPLTTTAGVSSMVVNAGNTNAVYSWSAATSTASYLITGINFVISASSVIMKGGYWMALLGGLTDGVLVQASSQGVYSQLAVLKINEDFLAYCHPANINVIGSTDFIQARIPLKQPIKAGSGDGVQVVVRDNLNTNTGGGLFTSGTPNLYYMHAFAEGIRLTA